MGAEVVGRMYDTLSSLSLAAILLVTENPYAIVNSGFLLSFSAILGICLVAKPLTETVKEPLDRWCESVYFDTPKPVILYRKAVHWLIMSLAGSVGISLFTLPVVLYSYFEVPVLGVFLNILVIPLMSVLLFAGIAGGVTAAFSSFLGTFFMGSVHYILVFYQFLCSITDNIPFNRLCIGRPEIWQIVMYYACLLTAVYIIKNHKKKWAYSLAALCVSLLVLGWRFSYGMEVHMIDVGQGDGIFVSTKGLKCLFDGGSSDISSVGTYRIYTFLKSHGVSELDYVFVSHTDKDHISGISELIEMNGLTFKIKTLVLPYYSKADSEENYMQLRQSAENAGIRVLYASAGNMDISAGDFSLTCVSPYTNVSYSDINASSAVYMLEYKDFSMLFTGDMTQESEKVLLNNVATEGQVDLSSLDCLKVAHHGSKTSSSEEFITKISPKLALISCGIDNSYGHPSARTVETLKSAGCDIYETDQCGQISLYYTGDGVKVRTKLG
jgi:competence protein ComEC